MSKSPMSLLFLFSDFALCLMNVDYTSCKKAFFNLKRECNNHYIFSFFLQVVGTICLLFLLAPQLAPILAVLMLVVSVLVGKFCFPFCYNFSSTCFILRGNCGKGSTAFFSSLPSSSLFTQSYKLYLLNQSSFNSNC